MPDPIQSRYSTLTSIGIRGLFIVAVLSGIHFLGYNPVNSLAGILVGGSLPVMLLGMWTALMEAETYASRSGSPQETQVRGEEYTSGTSVPTQVWGRGTALHWLIASSTIVLITVTAFYYQGITDASLAVVNAIVFVVMVGLGEEL